MSLEEELICHAYKNMDVAGITDPEFRQDIAELLVTFAHQEMRKTTKRHEKLDLFSRLAQLENLPSKQAVERVRHNPAYLRPWQRFVLDHFPERDFLKIPDYARLYPSMWRAATWENVVSDTVHHGGTVMPAVLSMAYKPKVIVEMGMRDGTTTLYLCKLNQQARVYGVELNARLLDADLPCGFTAMMQKVNNLTVAIMPSWEFSMPGQVDLCFIDGEHNGDAPLKDSWRAWENRNQKGDWCIAWDDYHPDNPDVYGAVNRFVSEVGMPLNKIASWVYIGTKHELEQYL